MHVRAVKINTSTYAYIFGGATAAVGRGCDTRGMNIGGSGLSLPLSKQTPTLYLYAYIFGQGHCSEDGDHAGGMKYRIGSPARPPTGFGPGRACASGAVGWD